MSPLSAQPTHQHTACLIWLTGACWLDDRAMPSVAAAEDEEDADALELDSAPALLLPLASSAALADRGWRAVALGRLYLRDRGQWVTARPLLNAVLLCCSA